MNNATFLHTIYVDFEPRAVFDGSMVGFFNAMEKIDPDLNLFALEDIMVGECILDEEMGEYFEELGAYWGEYCTPDELGVYLPSLKPKQAEFQLLPVQRVA